jgi:hypothetical protein
MERAMYNNPENISESEIQAKLAYGFANWGTNRNKRTKVLESYSTNKISKNEWINTYCKENKGQVAEIDAGNGTPQGSTFRKVGSQKASQPDRKWCRL